MPRIRFLFDPKIPRDKVNEWAEYLKGSIHNVSDDEAQRWLRRGNVEILTTREVNRILREAEKEEEKKEEEEGKEEEKKIESPASQKPEIRAINTPNIPVVTTSTLITSGTVAS